MLPRSSRGFIEHYCITALAVMLRFNHYGCVACLATYVGNHAISNGNSSSCSYDRQIPIRHARQTSNQSEEKSTTTKKFTYVIVGCGVSGSAALGEILRNSNAQKNGGRDILIVDSQREAFNKLGNSGIMSTSNMGRVQYMVGMVVDMNLPSRELKLTDGSTVTYENCLISVGSKLADMDFGEKVLAEDCASDLVDMSVSSSTEELMKAVRAGLHVSLIGADTWGVISIASQLADFSRLNGYKGTVSIVTPSPGVMASSLPRYLSVALGKRLTTKGVELAAYSQVRYISGPSTFAFGRALNEGSSASVTDKANIGIYLSRVYDSLNTSILYTDKVGLFPNSSPAANQGPPLNCSKHFGAKAGLEVGLNGGFLVNKCMLASDGVYLSGEVANVRTVLGRGVFTGVDHAHHTGLVAGRNMAGVFDVYDHIPVYEASAEESDIHLTFVGHCSSAFETHGFWWKLGGASSQSIPSSSASQGSKSDNDSSSSSSSKGKKDSNTTLDKPESVETEVWNVPQQSFGQRMQQEFFGLFGYRPPKEGTGTKAVSLAPKGKLNVRKIDEDNKIRSKLQPPLGLGVLFYVDNEIVVGVLISGSPLAQQREREEVIPIGSSKLKIGKSTEDNSTVKDDLSFSELIHARARSFIGKSLNEVAAKVEADIPPADGTGVTDFRSGRLIRLQNMSEIASYVIAPAIIPIDKNDRDVKYDRAEFRKNASLLPRPNYRYSASSRTIINAYVNNVQPDTSTIAPTIMQENVFHSGGDLTGTRAEKLAAAYASGLRYGIEGPGKA